MSKTRNDPALRLEAPLAGLLALAVAARKGQDERKTELILADAGLTNIEIGALMGQEPNAIRVAVQRGREGK